MFSELQQNYAEEGGGNWSKRWCRYLVFSEKYLQSTWMLCVYRLPVFRDNPRATNIKGLVKEKVPIQ